MVFNEHIVIFWLNVWSRTKTTIFRTMDFFGIKNCKNEINNTNIKIFTYKTKYIHIKYIKITKNTNFFCIQNKCTCAYGIKCL